MTVFEHRLIFHTRTRQITFSKCAWLLFLSVTALTQTKKQHGRCKAYKHHWYTIFSGKGWEGQWKRPAYSDISPWWFFVWSSRKYHNLDSKTCTMFEADMQIISADSVSFQMISDHLSAGTAPFCHTVEACFIHNGGYEHRNCCYGQALSLHSAGWITVSLSYSNESSHYGSTLYAVRKRRPVWPSKFYSCEF